MVPDIEEVRRELEVLVFGYTEILADGNVPVLLKRTAERISPEVSETCGAINTDRRRTADGSRIEELIDPAVNVALSLSGLHREAGIQGCRAGVRTAQGKSRASAGVDDGEGRPGLKRGDATKRPPRQERALEASLLRIERQVPGVVDDQPVGAIKIRWPVGMTEISLIVDRRIERSVPAGGGVQSLRPGVRCLEVERPGKPVFHRDL